MPFELVPTGTHIDFIRRRHVCLVLSAALILAGLVAIVARGGVPMGIDFTGGIELQLLFDEDVAVDVGRIRQAVSAAGVDDATVVRFGEEGSNEYLVKFSGDIDAAPALLGAAPEAEGIGEGAADASGETAEGEPGARDEGAAADAEASLGAGNDRIARVERTIRQEIGPFTQQRVEFVGPRVGEELREDGSTALFLAAVAILIYITFRFSSRYAPGAIAAVIHDLAVTGGLLVILGIEFDLQILAAMLAILGYSLNDTIIIYDRIRENLELRTATDLEEVLNTSVNQTLSRTVLTSMTTILVLLSLFALGGDVIRPFALAMLIGVLVGTYSSIFIAAPILLALERRFGAPSEAKPRKVRA